jgi:hypothetical protein
MRSTMGLGHRPEVRFVTREYLDACEKELAGRKADIKALEEKIALEATCQHCGGTGRKPIDLHESKRELIRRWCAEAGIDIAPDDTVSRQDAARLVDRSPLTLRNWALEGKGLAGRKDPNGRYRYSIFEITKWVWQNHERMEVFK